MAHAIASQRIMRGSLIPTAQSVLVLAHLGERDEAASSSVPNKKKRPRKRAVLAGGAGSM